MMRFVLHRVALALPLFLGVVTVVFVLLELSPGDPVQALVGDYPVSPEYVAEIREKYGLDDPLWQRFLSYVGNVLTGDLGYSFANRRPVSELIVDRMGNTLLLTLSALTFAAIVALLLGVWAGTTKRRWVDNLITGGGIAAFSIPSFWLGQVLLIVFALLFGILPVSGMSDIRAEHTGLGHVADVASHLILPMLALSVREIGTVSRIVRTSVRDTLGKDHIWTARAKGLDRPSTIRRHVVRNSLLPVVTVIGYSFGFAMSGSVLIETVFGWPGMGRLLYQAIVAKDNAVVIGVVLLIAATVLVVNLVTDIAYSIIDPRIRYASPSGGR